MKEEPSFNRTKTWWAWTIPWCTINFWLFRGVQVRVTWWKVQRIRHSLRNHFQNKSV